MSNAILRLLTALIGIPLVLIVAYLGGWWFGGLLMAAVLMAQYELYRLMEAGEVYPLKVPGMVLGGLFFIGNALPIGHPLLVFLILVLIASAPLFRRKGNVLENLAGTVFGAVYPTMLLGFLWHLRVARGPGIEDLQAFYLTVVTLALVWSTDTFAYYAGRTLGKHPLAPRVSPRKTWEGAVGGAIGAVLVSIVFKLTLLEFLGWGHVLVMALICGVVSQLGDLAESQMKRAVGVKDSGGILPGHGGLLDRLDALILAAPLVFLYLNSVARLFN